MNKLNDNKIEWRKLCYDCDIADIERQNAYNSYRSYHDSITTNYHHYITNCNTSCDAYDKTKYYRDTYLEIFERYINLVIKKQNFNN